MSHGTLGDGLQGREKDVELEVGAAHGRDPFAARPDAVVRGWISAG